MKALIIYQDFASAVKADAALHRAAQHANVGIHWDINPYRVDLLKVPRTAEEVLTEAMDAHPIVLSGRRERLLPIWLCHWLEHWAKRRKFQDAALAVIYTASDGRFSTSSIPELAEFTTRHGLKSIFGGNLAVAPTSIEVPPSFPDIHPAKVEASLSKLEATRQVVFLNHRVALAADRFRQG